MRSSALALISLLSLAAYATEQGNTSFDAYDPSKPVDLQQRSTMLPVPASALAEPWINKKSTLFAGFTAPQTGRWQWPGHEVGLESGNAACQAQGADHVCTLAELTIANENGEFRDAPPDISFWTNDEDAGQGASCGNVAHSTHGRGGSYTYEGADASWGGNARTVRGHDYTEVVISNPPDVKWDDACLRDPEACTSFVPTGFPCNAQRAIACCN